MIMSLPLALSNAFSDTGAPLFQAGFCEADITPAIGMEQPGGYGKSFHKTLHDPCKVRVAVFDDGKHKAVLVGIDALMIPRQIVEKARAEIQQHSGIPPESILIGASHSHSSGPVGMVQPGQFDWASPFVKKLAYEESSCADADYLDQVLRGIVEAVGKAGSARVPVRLGFGVGKEDTVAFNRRFKMKDGLVYTHPGQGNPDIVEIAGPIDPGVGVIGVWNEEDKLLGCIVNYACHATTNPGGISANWIYYMEHAIRGNFGSDTIVVFLQGFSGDVTQVDNLTQYQQPSGDRSARFVGGRIGAEAVKVLLGMEKGSAVTIDTKSKTLTMNHRIPNPDRVKQCTELAQKDPAQTDRTGWLFAKEIVLLDALLSREKQAQVEVQAVQIGPAVFLSAPGEMFCQFGLDLKTKSGFLLTFPVSLANGCVGYVPTLDALGERGGGYETRLTSYSNLEPNAGNIMVEELIGLTKTMQPGDIPTPKTAPSFKGPWSYGNVPPELD